MKRHVAVLLVFIFVSLLLTARSAATHEGLSSDQTFFQLVYLGKTNPAYADYRVPELDAYLPFRFTTYLRQFIADPVVVYRTLLPWLVLAYLLAMYALLYRLFSSRLLAATIALASLVPRTALGSQYWGILGLGHATHRAFIQPFLVILFYLAYRYRDEPKRLALVFLGVGLASGLYPTQGFYFAAILILVALFRDRLRPRAFARCLGYGTVFVVGTLYYVVPSLTIGLNIDRLDPSLISTFNEALRYRFAYTFYPGALTTYARSVALDSLILVVVYVAVNVRRAWLPAVWREVLAFSNRFLIATLVVTFGLPLAQDLVSRLFGTRLFIFDQFGESKFVYLSLYLGLAMGVAMLDQRLRLQYWWRRAVLGLALVAVSVGTFFILQGVIARFYPLEVSAQADPAFTELCTWIKANTPTQAVILAQDFSLRYCSDRRLWVTWKEGMVELYAQPAASFVQWYQRLREQDRIFAAHDGVRLLELARSHQLDWVVIETQTWNEPLPSAPVLYRNAHYAVVDSRTANR